MLIGVASLILTAVPTVAWALTANWQTSLRNVTAAQVRATSGTLEQQGYGSVWGQVRGRAWVQGHMSVSHASLVRWNSTHTARLMRGWPIRFETSTSGWWKFTLIGSNIGVAGLARGSASVVGHGHYTVASKSWSWPASTPLRITIK